MLFIHINIMLNLGKKTNKLTPKIFYFTKYLQSQFMFGLFLVGVMCPRTNAWQIFLYFFKNGLDKPNFCAIMFKYEFARRATCVHAPLAQLDRVFGYEPKGRGFESLTACQKKYGYHNRGTRIFLPHRKGDEEPPHMKHEVFPCEGSESRQ